MSMASNKCFNCGNAISIYSTCCCAELHNSTQRPAPAVEADSVSIPLSMQSIKRRIDICWKTAEMFLENKDAHGIHDMGVEIQALSRALDELSKLKVEV